MHLLNNNYYMLNIKKNQKYIYIKYSQKEKLNNKHIFNRKILCEPSSPPTLFFKLSSELFTGIGIFLETQNI